MLVLHLGSLVQAAASERIGVGEVNGLDIDSSEEGNGVEDEHSGQRKGGQSGAVRAVNAGDGGVVEGAE